MLDRKMQKETKENTFNLKEQNFVFLLSVNTS